jgi:hypothetical protein
MPSGTLGYNKAEVTIGGVDTRGLSPQHDVRDGRCPALLHRRGGRRHRLARRVQFSMGVVVGIRGRASSHDLIAKGFHVIARACIALSLYAIALAASAQVKVGLMVSATGPTTAIGIPQKNTGDCCRRRSATRPSSTSSSTTAATRRAPCRTSRS